MLIDCQAEIEVFGEDVPFIADIPGSLLDIGCLQILPSCSDACTLYIRLEVFGNVINEAVVRKIYGEVKAKAKQDSSFCCQNCSFEVFLVCLQVRHLLLVLQLPVPYSQKLQRCTHVWV